MKTNNLSREYKIDYINEKIIISKKFLKAAGVFNSPEYTLMKELRADYIKPYSVEFEQGIANALISCLKSPSVKKRIYARISANFVANGPFLSYSPSSNSHS